MITIDGHSFDEKLLNGNWVIDAGCRGFGFTETLLASNCDVFSIDIDRLTIPDLLTEALPTTNHIRPYTRWNFKHAALMAKPGEVEAHYFGNGTGNFVKGINEQPYDGPDRPCETKKVQAITLQDIYSEIGTDIDLLKLDIEGSEYEILANLEPIPRQVTVEFHEHCHPDLHKKWIDRVLQNMAKHYQLTQFPCNDWPRYKYMDCLFIRKDLI